MRKTALVMGTGISGSGAAELLLRNGWRVCVSDSAGANVPDGCEDRSFLSPELALKGVDLLVLSPGVPMTDDMIAYARLCGTEVIGEVELGYRYSRGDIVAVTGTNGKTTVTMLIKKILECAGIKSYALGNLGASFSAAADKIEEGAVVVLELSSFQLESIADFRSKYAICLNITPDHYERHGSFAEYAEAKRKIFLNQKNDDIAVLNYDDATVREFEQDIASAVYFFSTEQKVKGSYLEGGRIYFADRGVEYIAAADELRIKGEHNIANALAAVTAAKLMGVDNAAIRTALRTFSAPRFRMQYCGTIEGKRVYNDSKATNIDSTLKACAAMKGSTVLIMGGYDKGISYERFFAKLPSSVKRLIVTGDNAESIKEDMPAERAFTFEILPSLYLAAVKAFEGEEENVLFSPSTSSFDRYSDFEERGEAFDCIIRAIGCGKN